MAVMGLDVSLTSTGLTVRDGGKPIFITAIKTSKDMPWDERITKITEKIFYAIKHFKVKEIVIENYSFGSTIGREILGEIHGVLMYEFLKQGIPFIKVPPTQVKLFGCGKGAAPKVPEGKAKSTWKKVWVVDEVNTRYDMAFKYNENDMADSFIIALLAETLVKVKNGEVSVKDLPDHQQEVVAKILNIKLEKKSRRK